MIIYLDDSKKHVLNKILNLYNENEQKKRIQIKKSELSRIFEMDESIVLGIIDALEVTRFIDVPFENKQQIAIIVYKDMIEEQLACNMNYVRKFKEWPDTNVFVKKDTIHEETDEYPSNKENY